MKTTTLTKLAGGALGVLAAASLAASAQANTTLIAGTGWINDNASAANVPTDNSTISFTVGAGQTDFFSISDGYLLGDVYSVSVNGGAATDTTFVVYPTNFPTGLGNTAFDANWTNGGYSHLQAAFGAGAYTLVIEDISSPGPGYPAGLAYRLDTAPAPEPATWALFIAGFGLTGFALRRRGYAARVA